MTLKIRKNLFLKLIKESKNVKMKSSLKESSRVDDVLDYLGVTSPEDRETVKIATRAGYHGTPSPEAKEILSQLRKEYDEVGYHGLSPVFKAIIEVQEDQKEDYKANLSGYSDDFDEEAYIAKRNQEHEEWVKEREELEKKKELERKEREENTELDNLYQTQDDLAGIRTSHYHETVDRKLDEMFYTNRSEGTPEEKLAEIEKDKEYDEFHKQQNEKDLESMMSDPDIENKMSPEARAEKEEDEYYQDLIDSLQDAESEREYQKDREIDRRNKLFGS